MSNRTLAGRRVGFTLIELLVVIAIIAILAAILFPVFAKAREKARTSSCASNLKQIGLALMQYTNDYDELVVRSSYGTSLGDGSSNAAIWKWMDSANPYVKNVQIFNCPSDSTSPKYVYNQPGVGGGGTNWGSYTINAHKVNGNTHCPSTNDIDCALAQIADPAGTFWVGENAQNAGNYYRFIPTNTSPSGMTFVANSNPRQLQTNNSTAQSSNLIERHTDMMNALFCDGHVKGLKLGAFLAPAAGNTYQMLTVEAD